MSEWSLKERKMIQMKVKNDYFCKSKGRVRFLKNDHFSVHLHLILNSIFEK